MNENYIQGNAQVPTNSSSFVRPSECRNVRIIKYITTILDIKAQREYRKPWLYCGASVINKCPACDTLMVVILSDIYARDVKLLVRDHVALTHAELKWLFIRIGSLMNEYDY
uniref:Uncharacterized protein n=1 Tax=Tanacetum cinerariifolium TaxID=118510 RepID=A0A6L2KKF6_TANCI|nr:hypothetical protein [Tanacetum cinerariifolium]